MSQQNPLTKSSSTAIDAFLDTVAKTPLRSRPGTQGKLLFAMDATASRGPTWDLACNLQTTMFSETKNIGELELSLCYYNGYNNFRATGWLTDAASLNNVMTQVRCEGGLTQIARVLRHTIAENRRHPVNALVFVGDCMEEEIDTLCHHAGQLGLLGVPAFLFHEGVDPVAEQTFREIARLSGGAYSRFDRSSAQTLRDLLSAVAVFAVGGNKALRDFEAARGRRMLHFDESAGPRR